MSNFLSLTLVLVALAAIASGSPVASGPGDVNQDHSGADMDTSEHFFNPYLPRFGAGFRPGFGYPYGYPALNAPYAGLGVLPGVFPIRHHPFLYDDRK